MARIDGDAVDLEDVLDFLFDESKKKTIFGSFNEES